MRVQTESLERILRRYAVGYHFYARDLRSGIEVELGERRNYPFASCFKLAVLDAFFEGCTSAEVLEELQVISPDQFSPGGGIVNFLDSTVHFTLLQLIQLMLAVSDGTATDFLISRLGREAIDDALRRLAPDSTLRTNLGEMVRRFHSMPLAIRCKEGLTPSESEDLITQTSTMGQTHGKDLASLALGVWEKVVHPSVAASYQRCLQTAPFRPRSSLFLDAPRQFGKTGTLGRGYFVNDCGILLDEAKRPWVSFGYASYGWQIPTPLVDVIGGLIGIEIARLFNVPLILSPGLCVAALEAAIR